MLRPNDTWPAAPRQERMVAAQPAPVESVRKKYHQANMELLDLIQEGTIGRARLRSDPTALQVSTYAYWYSPGITRRARKPARNPAADPHNRNAKQAQKGHVAEPETGHPELDELACGEPGGGRKDCLCRRATGDRKQRWRRQRHRAARSAQGEHQLTRGKRRERVPTRDIGRC